MYVKQSERQYKQKTNLINWKKKLIFRLNTLGFLGSVENEWFFLRVIFAINFICNLIISFYHLQMITEKLQPAIITFLIASNERIIWVFHSFLKVQIFPTSFILCDNQFNISAIIIVLHCLVKYLHRMLNRGNNGKSVL